RKKKEEIM
ncbi:hypothetical protein CFOL_v3_19173, partial [Cephalotus follicularis]